MTIRAVTALLAVQPCTRVQWNVSIHFYFKYISKTTLKSSHTGTKLVHLQATAQTYKHHTPTLSTAIW